MKYGTKPYLDLHKWLAKQFGKADHCDMCGGGKRFHWSSRDHKYTKDLQEYWMLCTRCHYWYDREVIGKKRLGGSNPVFGIKYGSGKLTDKQLEMTNMKKDVPTADPKWDEASLLFHQVHHLPSGDGIRLILKYREKVLGEEK